jgi:hypothetical protein
MRSCLDAVMDDPCSAAKTAPASPPENQHRKPRPEYAVRETVHRFGLLLFVKSGKSACRRERQRSCGIRDARQPFRHGE